MHHLTRRSTLTLLGGTALSMPFVRRAHAEDMQLNIYNWSDYIGESTVADFEAATGIKVAYDNFASIEEAEAKALTGGTGYDLMLMGGSSLPRLVPTGIFRPLDRALLPSWGNFDPAILKLAETWDPGNTHAFVYTWGTTGVAFNPVMVAERLPGADLTSLDMIFKPENAAKLADCGITLLDSPNDVFRLAITYLGLGPNDLSEEAIAKATDLLMSVRPSIRTFDNTNLLNALPNREICVANTWSGDYAVAAARGAEAGVQIDYFVPQTGGPIWVDTFCIPTDAPHPTNAHKFLEYLLQPEVIAATTNLTWYANANAASTPFILPEVLANPATYPTDDIKARLWAPRPVTDDELRLITRAWRKIRNG